MLNKIILFSLNNRLAVLLGSLLLTLAGVYVAYNIEVDVFPDLNAPTVVVMTEASGMAPEEVERMVTFPLETAVNGATNVRRVRSSSTTGFSVVWVEFDWGMDIYQARQVVSEKLATVAESLPENIGKPTLGPQSSILGEVLIIGLTADTTSLMDLRTIADWTIRPRLLSTGGVAQVTVLGGDIKEYQVLLDPFRMKHYGVTLDEALAAVDNFNQNESGGIIYEYANEYIINGAVASNDTELLGKSLVKSVNDEPILLEHIADVQIGIKAPKMGLASEKGKPAVLLTVTKQPATSTLELTDKLDEEIENLKANLPNDVGVSTDSFRQSRFINSSIGNVQSSLYEGCLFVVIVLFFFLMNVRTTVISLLAIPLSLLSSILILKALGLTINTMSLGGMAIAIGSLVDDAIVDVENVFRHLRENRLKPPAERLSVLKVVYEASKEVRMPILNSTLIIVASFLPLFFLSGMEGRMLTPLGVTFIVSLFASTVIALTLTPVLCSYLLAKDAKKDKKEDKEPFVARHLKSGYSRLLGWILNYKRTVLIACAVVLVASIALFTTFGRSFLPPFNEGSFTISVATTPGTSLEESDRIGRMAEEIILTVPEVQTTVRKTGRAELDEHALGVNVSEIEAPFVLDERKRDVVANELREKLEDLSGVNLEIGQPISHRIDAMLSGSRANVAIKIFGADLNKLFSIGNQIKSAVQDVEGIADLNVEQQVERPQLMIRPNREIMAKFGITVPEFKEFVGTMLAGQVVSQVFEDGRTFDLTVKVNNDQRTSIDDISNLMIDANGKKIPLSQVAEIKSVVGPNTINRENVQRNIVVGANVAGRDLRSVVNEIQERIAQQIELPEDYYIQYGGQFESEAQASRTLMTVSIFAILIIFLLIYNQFRDTKQAAAIMFNLPMALIGGVIIIWLSSGVISIPAIIGFISLFGIATRNGLLLVERYNVLVAEGNTVNEAIRQGSLDRLNPILMMAISTGLALLPLALNADAPGNEIQSPMAQVILGGLVTSTLLNMVVIPIIYGWIAKDKDTAHETLS
ncbi:MULTISPECIES: efflux RND transporter permease subunit [Parapedobacter]|uniref:Cu(I)/Ag(I) efflux system membrane protein CusA/SilA n=1 Tax=Parapedobacter indicus TaxID=1477437 RepID=A0A1I3DRB6_9SPHI|nr:MULTISPECIES: efflux RND transporter permease subunit [Parapedobacter]MEC3879080.1 efflux RND transporter permease subunit [Parapedobacter sp. 10938]PPL04809.1 Cu(I)/Ag(I) efflux system membrane protein CusA/SilA [Parapedobacter indicus]SFH89290.1 Cu(I)/Ag(I) efflux system membrane protein CusA/SilA [Parapedobacter indicus]